MKLQAPLQPHLIQTMKLLLAYTQLDMPVTRIDGGYMTVRSPEITDGPINLHFGLFHQRQIKFHRAQNHIRLVTKQSSLKDGVTR